MKNKDLAQKIKLLRNKKGYSQEELSEKTGLSLRTIQRIENGETEPRGDSIKRLAEVFDVSTDDITDWTVQEDKGFLLSLNLSALSFLIYPLLGVMIPLIIWISKKDKIKNLNDLAKDLLNFQITWTILVFIGLIIIMKTTNGVVFYLGFLYLFNLGLIIVNTIRINQGESTFYQPKIRFLR